ncbi:MAG TPA: hypothetical protein VFY73_19385 [Ideonella sp.]|uniref:hypothetical protein n=1 Tax=Ideonella sp. TaxID=1929293 RepID=UPI002E32E824|nr:hypothetical protein [Ideonella sp.]HEX5686197.1 hypothetical protein [Ideonella sp.]
MHQRDPWGRPRSGEQDDLWGHWGRREPQQQGGEYGSREQGSASRDTYRDQARDREFAYGRRPNADWGGDRGSYGDQQGQPDWSPGQYDRQQGGQYAGRRHGRSAEDSYRPVGEPYERYGPSAPHEASRTAAGPWGGPAPREQWSHPSEQWGGHGEQDFNYLQRDTLSPEPGWGGRHDDQFDPDYHQWRNEQMRALDEDYRSWRQDRYKKFSTEFDQWRAERSRTSAPAGDTGKASDSPGDASSGGTAGAGTRK